MAIPVYLPSVFDQSELNDAKNIVLTPEDNVSVETRWATETPWLLSYALRHINPPSLIVDYGCGVGRMAGAMVQHGFSVVGVDTSFTMRQHAINEVSNDHFTPVGPSMFEDLVNSGLLADAALSIWVLQHCYNLESEIERIHRGLKKDGILMLVDMNFRAIPTDQGWVDDGQNVKEYVSKKFTLIQQYPFNLPEAPDNLKKNAFVAFYRKR